jgi:hypothetical protein
VIGGYRVGKNETVEERLEIGRALLRSEGIEPAWVPYTEAERAKARASLAGQNGSVAGINGAVMGHGD